MLVVNIEVSEYGDFSKRKMGQDVLHFRSQIVKGFYTVGGVRLEVYNTEKLSERVTLKS